jgi:N-glycosylase/DNA lyase
VKQRLENYFQLGHVLESLYKTWSSPLCATDKRHPINEAFCEAAAALPGLRLLRQDPVECVFSFLCSQNNNISRITQMIDAMCSRYGTLIGELEGEKHYSFPTLDVLAKVPEQELRDTGFGYRAKFIPKSAQQILAKGLGWLESLRSMPYPAAAEALQELHGVGPKVADCIALFSLDKLDAVPCDTHVWQIAQRYLPMLRNKNPAPALHPMVREFFLKQFGDKCGWAHTILFAAELREFQSVLSAAAASTPALASPVVKTKGKRALQELKPALASTPPLEVPAVKSKGKRAFQLDGIKPEVAPQARRTRRT